MQAYAIWENVPHDDRRSHEQLVGIVIGTDEQANKVLSRLREEEARRESVGPHFWRFWGSSRFWKQEVVFLTEDVPTPTP